MLQKKNMQKAWVKLRKMTWKWAEPCLRGMTVSSPSQWLWAHVKITVEESEAVCGSFTEDS